MIGTLRRARVTPALLPEKTPMELLWPSFIAELGVLFLLCSFSESAVPSPELSGGGGMKTTWKTK